MKIRSGPWDHAEVEQFLEESVIPIRLATIGRSGPLVQSLWFLYDNGSLWCATQAEAVVVSRLTADPRCGVEVARDAPPYRGVRGSAQAVILPGAAGEILPRLIERYLGSAPSPLGEWLLSRIDSEVAIRLDDLQISSWDFSSRM